MGFVRSRAAAATMTFAASSSVSLERKNSGGLLLPPIPEDKTCDWCCGGGSNSPAHHLSPSSSFMSLDGGDHPKKDQEECDENDDFPALALLWINLKRSMERNLRNLKMSGSLNELAQMQAARMAATHEISHSTRTLARLKSLLQSDDVGEIVHSAPSYEALQDELMVRASPDDHVIGQNVLSRDFSKVGIAASQSVDGTVYLCMLFRGKKGRQ